jgi:hypothetical protein
MSKQFDQRPMNADYVLLRYNGIGNVFMLFATYGTAFRTHVREMEVSRMH